MSFNTFWKGIAIVGLTALAVLLFASYRNPIKHRDSTNGQRSAPPGAGYGGMKASNLHYLNAKHTMQSPNEMLNTLRRDGVSINLAAVDLDSMSEQQLRLTIHSYLDNTDTICARKLRMGDLDDGGWDICDDPDVAPQPPCLVYSFGIASDWSFDDQTSTVYGCHVFSFDPSIKQETYNRSSHVHFYKVGIHSKTTKDHPKHWEMYTFRDLKKKLGHENEKINVVKMDVEHAEWGVIPQMIADGMFNNIDQFLVEYHVTREKRNDLLSQLKAIQMVEKLGFKKFYAHKNWHCGRNVIGFPVKMTSCYEVHYVRRP